MGRPRKRRCNSQDHGLSEEHIALDPSSHPTEQLLLKVDYEPDLIQMPPSAGLTDMDRIDWDVNFQDINLAMPVDSIIQRSSPST